MTDTDKLVEMARAAGFNVGRYSTGQRYIQSSDGTADVTKELAAFASAHIASLCGDVEPVARMSWDYRLSIMKADNNGPFVCWTDHASTVAALKAESDAALAWAAVLEAAALEGARRIESLKRECSDPESPIAIQNARYMNVSYFLRSALTKGQP